MQVYAQDASFVAYSWKKGDVAGTKEAAMQMATLMCLTSSITPTLMPSEGAACAPQKAGPLLGLHASL